MTRESSIEGVCVQLAKDNGWLVRKLSWIGVTGAPDRFFLKAGQHVFIEFKRPNGRTKLQQDVQIKDLRTHGAEVHVVDSVDHFKMILGLV